MTILPVGRGVIATFLGPKRVLWSLLLFSVLLLSGLHNYIPVIPDSAIYILLAESVAAGQGYQNPHIRENPVVPQTYPPVFPTLLVPVIALFGRNYLLMRLLVAVFGVLVVYLSYRLFREISGEDEAFLIMLFTATSWGVVAFSLTIMADIPYMAFSLLALLFAERYRHCPEWLSRWGFLTALFVCLSSMTKSLGLSVLLGILCALIISSPERNNYFLRGKKVFLILLFFATSTFIWKFVESYNGPNTTLEESYWKFFSLKDAYDPELGVISVRDFVGRIYSNLYFYLRGLAQVIVYYAPASKYLVAIIACIPVLGFMYCFTRKRTTLEYYLIFHLVIILSNHRMGPNFEWGGVPRYIVYLTPLLGYYLLRGLQCGIGFLGRGMELSMSKRYARVLSTTFAVLIIINLVSIVHGNVLMNYSQQRFYGDKWSAYVDLVEWVKQNTEVDSIILCRQPYFTYLWTNREAYIYPFTRDPIKIMGFIEKNKVSHIIKDAHTKMTKAYLEPVIKAYPEKFSAVYSQDEGLVYRVMR